MTTFERFTPRCGSFHAAALRPMGRSPTPSATRGSRAWWAMRCTSTPSRGDPLSPCRQARRAVSSAFAFGGANRQVELLQNEGVEFIDASHVDMARFCVRALPYIAE